MYKCYQNNIVSGAKSFSPLWIISENLLYLFIWILAGYLVAPVWKPFGLPLLTVIWIVVVVTVQILLKKHNCSGCYYYDKWCHLGWGKIASTLFEQNSGNPETGMKLSLFYVVSPPLIFIISLGFTIINTPGWFYWFWLALFTILNVITFPVRKKGCSRCAMRETCPGSAVKRG